jgi:hypothetical protein
MPKANAPTHSPSSRQSPAQLDKQNVIATAAHDFAETLIGICPTGLELDEVMSYLRTTVLWANQAIVATPASRGAGG